MNEPVAAAYPLWVRPTQFVGGLLLCWLVARRWSMSAAVVVVLAFRAALEPAPWPSYSTSVLAAAVLLVGPGRDVASSGVAALASMLVAYAYPLSPALGIVRLLFLIASATAAMKSQEALDRHGADSLLGFQPRGRWRHREWPFSGGAADPVRHHVEGDVEGVDVALPLLPGVVGVADRHRELAVAEVAATDLADDLAGVRHAGQLQVDGRRATTVEDPEPVVGVGELHARREPGEGHRAPEQDPPGERDVRGGLLEEP